MTPASPSFVTLLERQRDRYAALVEMGAEQRALIAKGDAEALLVLLGRRQEVVDELGRIDQALNACRADWAGHYQRLGAEDRERVDGLVRQIQEMLGAVMDMDREDVEALAQQKARVGVELTRVPTQRQVQAAYGGASGVKSRYMDQQDRDA